MKIGKMKTNMIVNAKQGVLDSEKTKKIYPEIDVSCMLMGILIVLTS